MARGRLAEAAGMMEGNLLAGDPEAIWSGAAIDSRVVAPGELFFALPGEHTDGHRFVADALERGACAAIVQRVPEPPARGALIRVDDTMRALHLLTSAVRERTPERLAAVTGSVGKTTTKELLAAMLACRYRVGSSPGNLNNLLGFPISLLGIPEDTEWMVAEMGMSTPGELGRISRLGRPDVAVFTNVRPVHLEFFDDLAAITEAKAELLEGLPPDGLVVANAGDPEVVRIARRHAGPVIWFALEAPADYVASEIAPAAGGPGSRFLLTAGSESRVVELPLHGRYNVENCLAAAACAHTLGVSLPEIAAAVAIARPAPMRGIVHSLGGGVRVVDDSYNSNPAALSRALESARSLPANRHWVVCGDMLELGEGAVSFHRAAGEEAARLGFSLVVGVGELAREVATGAKAGGARARWYPDATAAARELGAELRPGDLVLVKGSRGVALETVVEALLAAGGEGS